MRKNRIQFPTHRPTCRMRNAVPRSVGFRLPHTRIAGSDWDLTGLEKYCVIMIAVHVPCSRGDIGEGVWNGADSSLGPSMWVNR